MGLKDVKVGDKLRYLGHDPADTGELIWGRVYEVVDIDYDVIVIDTINNGSWAIGEEYKNVDCFELVEEEKEGDSMTNKTNKVGEVLRSLPEVGDVVEMTYNKHYDTRVGDRFTIVSSHDGFVVGENDIESWNIYNQELGAYRLIKKAGHVEKEKSTLDLIANLAQEVTELKRELSDLRGATQTQAYEDNERIERILDDIVMLDERTQDANISEPKPVRKVVYEYERYYD